MSAADFYQLGKGMSPVHVSGEIVLSNSENIEVPSILLDTGALSANYMSAAYFAMHEKQLLPYVIKVDTTVRLGDCLTVKPISKAVNLSLVFRDGIDYDIKGGTNNDDIIVTVVDVSCKVFQTGHDIIIGLPTLLSDAMFPYFMRVLQRARKDKKYIDSMLNALSLNNSEMFVHNEGEVFNPFSVVLEEAPEDVDTPIPVLFEHALHFMEMSYDDSVKEYHSLFETHINKDMAAATNVIDLLNVKGVGLGLGLGTGVTYLLRRRVRDWRHLLAAP